MSNSLQSHGLQPAGLLCPWDSPGTNTRAGWGANLGLSLQIDSLPSESPGTPL